MSSMNKLFGIAMLITLSISSHADTIYKIVDKQGRVTYTHTPPRDSGSVSTIDVYDTPSDERIRAAEECHKRNIEAAQIMEQNRKQREKIISEENRIRRERQKQAQSQRTESYRDKDNRVYPYFYPYRPYWPYHRPHHRPPHRPDHRPDYRPIPLPEHPIHLPAW